MCVQCTLPGKNIKKIKSCPVSCHSQCPIYFDEGQPRALERDTLNGLFVIHCHSATFQTQQESEVILYLM